MKGLLPLFVGLFATFAFSWVGLALIPNFQIGHLDPQTDEEGADVYPAPQSGMAERGRHIYTANGCFYCHSQQTRPDYISADTDRTRDFDKDKKWAVRRSAPRDYIFDRPVLLGKERTGPDLSNIGKAAPVEEEGAAPGASPAGSPAPSTSASPAMAAASPAPAASASASPAAVGQNPQPAAATAGITLDASAKPGEAKPYSAAWLHQHLYSPRTLSPDSNMPAYRFLYEKRRISGEAAHDALKLVGEEAPEQGWEVVPTYDARCLVAFLMSRDQSHPLKEVKASTAAAPAAAASPGPASGKEVAK